VHCVGQLKLKSFDTINEALDQLLKRLAMSLEHRMDMINSISTERLFVIRIDYEF